MGMRLRVGLDSSGRRSRVPSGHLGAIYAVLSGSEARISVGFGGDCLAVRPNMGLVVPIPVNESYNTVTGYDAHSVLTDWYSRYKGMTFIQASGNVPPVRNPSSNDMEVGCAALNNICVGSFGWPFSTAGSSARNFMAFFTDSVSRFGNPYSSSTDGTHLEVEKPDLVAEGNYGHLAKLGSSTQWDTDIGTSFAAPVITGLVALVKDKCGGAQPVYDSIFYRSLFRTVGTLTANTVETNVQTTVSVNTCGSFTPIPNYPAPQLGCDHKGGAGPVDAKWLSLGCTSGSCLNGTCVYSGRGTASPDVGWTTIPAYIQESPAHPNSERDDSVSASLRMANAKWKKVFDLGSVKKGIRVRSTLSYYSCSVDSSHQPNGYSSSSLHTAVNFDWALCGVPNGGSLTECVFVADSLDDTNEGFDVRTPKEYSSLSVYLIAPKTNWSCTDMGGNTTTAEPFAYFVVTQ